MGWTFYNSNGEALIQNAESEATQAEMEAETAGAKFVPPDLLRFHPAMLKQFCSITSAGSLEAGSFNTASITDTGTGDRFVTIDDDLSDALYSVFVSQDGVNHPRFENRAVGGYNVRIVSTDHSTFADNGQGCGIFGDF
jgi:hypothetical protein